MRDQATSNEPLPTRHCASAMAWAPSQRAQCCRTQRQGWQRMPARLISGRSWLVSLASRHLVRPGPKVPACRAGHHPGGDSRHTDHHERFVAVAAGLAEDPRRGLPGQGTAVLALRQASSDRRSLAGACCPRRPAHAGQPGPVLPAVQLKPRRGVRQPDAPAAPPDGGAAPGDRREAGRSGRACSRPAVLTGLVTRASRPLRADLRLKNVTDFL